MVLNVYEVMMDKFVYWMSYVVGVRVFIKECGWNVILFGIGFVCFWLNVGMEVLDCLVINLLMIWSLSEWGVDMEFGVEGDEYDDGMGVEEIWVYRIFCIVVDIVNFCVFLLYY